MEDHTKDGKNSLIFSALGIPIVDLCVLWVPRCKVCNFASLSGLCVQPNWLEV